jgi:hypothetical protein
VDPDSRPVAYNPEARLDPFEGDDGAGLFSPLSVGSVGSVSSVGVDSRFKARQGGLKKLGKPRGPRLADIGASGETDDDDDGDDGDGDGDGPSSGLVSKLAKARVGSPKMKKRVATDDTDDAMDTEETTDTGGGRQHASKVRFGGGGGGGSGAAEGAFRPGADKTRSSASVSSVATGPQWLADVLETDDAEQGMVMMYAEGFSMYMQEQGLIP